jgi:hypothetical protein
MSDHTEVQKLDWRMIQEGNRHFWEIKAAQQALRAKEAASKKNASVPGRGV